MRKLTIKEAKDLSYEIADQPVLDMLEKAKSGVKDWNKVSRQNKGFTIGVFWNILSCKKYLEKEIELSQISKYRFLVQFGEFLDEKLKPKKTNKAKLKPTHHDPIF